jgi:Helix-turn-helix domain
VDRDALALLLSQGLSLAEIGRRFRRDESTIGYWVKKHGLRAVNADKHAPRGGLRREQVGALIDEGLSIREIASRTGYSATSVRHWIRRHDLETATTRRRAEGRRAKEAGELTTTLECVFHGRTEFRLEGRGAFRCLKCRSERVAQRRREIKEILVVEAGGACTVCGYNRYIGALQFHHRDPASKSFAIGAEGVTRSLASVREEAAKCDLVCANCHAEIEGGVRTLHETVDKVITGLRRREESTSDPV